MARVSSQGLRIVVTACVIGFAAVRGYAATKSVDLDATTANGAESLCELNVLQTFPVKIENKVTNRTGGDAFNFDWKSAGPGGFSSSAPSGTTGGVGSKWVWTTNQTVYSYTGSTCATDVCFLKTGGPDVVTSACSLGCLVDGLSVSITKGATPDEVVISWPATAGPYTVYRASSPRAVVDVANALITTDLTTYTDRPPAGTDAYYIIRGTSCLTPKPCSSDNDCDLATEGTCVSRGPFGAPGRSLFTNDVTVSSASLTSSLITFFSPPKEVFRVESSVAPGGSGIAFQQTLTNPTNQPLTVTVAEYPPGCCNEPHQLNCDGDCVDYLTDPNNCGGCGFACGDGYYCSEGSCFPSCPEGTTYCDGFCRDLENDRQNCGACRHVCETIFPPGDCEPPNCILDQICVEGSCQVCDPPSNTACDNRCTDVHFDADNCGRCGQSCNVLCPTGVGVCNGGGSCCCIYPDNHQECIPTPDGPPPPMNAGSKIPPLVEEAPICESPKTETVIPPGGTFTDCLLQGVLAKEVPTSVVACGNSIPIGNAKCANGDPASQGTFMKLVPDPTKPIGAAYVTPFAVHVLDASHDGLIQPDEPVQLFIEVLNAGPVAITGAFATLSSPPVDLSDDGIANPVSALITAGSSSYGTILGTPEASSDCNAPPPTRYPATNVVPFEIKLPLSHPGDTSRPFVLHFTGFVNENPFSMDVPIALGVAHTCNYAANVRDYDAVDGLYEPMAPLISSENAPSFPPDPFALGQVLPLKLRLSCVAPNLTDADIDAPQIVGLSEQTLGPLDIGLLALNDDTGTNDPFFRWDPAHTKWVFNLRTGVLGPGTFTLTVRLAGRKDYVTGFVVGGGGGD